MLQKLEDKFKDERNELEKAEMQAKQAHEMVVQDLDGQIKVPRSTHLVRIPSTSGPAVKGEL